MDIIAVTTCVNYSDILKHVIFQNSKFFKLWYIVTSSNDENTIALINEINIPNIQILFYSDFYKNSKFNFGGSRLFAQEYIDKNHQSANILFLDADIYLPDNFIETLPNTLEDNTLYGILKRLDYWTLDDFTNNTNHHLYIHSSKFVGFFQLYKQCSYKYENSYNCSKCDVIFRDKFPKRKNLQLTVKHFGREGVNWDGRKL